MALRALGDGRDRIFRQVAEVRPDAAAEILSVWTEAEAGLALGWLPPPLAARVLEAIARQSPAGDAGEAMRVIRQVSRPAVIAAALERMPQQLAIAILARTADDRAIATVQQMDPAAVRQLQAASPAIVGKLLLRTRSSFQDQVARHALT